MGEGRIEEILRPGQIVEILWATVAKTKIITLAFFLKSK